MKALLIMLLSTALSAGTVHGQGFQAPPADSVAIYFVRVSGMGALVGFKYFDGDRYIGSFRDQNYMRYICTPGKHLFWSTAENTNFMNAELSAGGIYLVVSNVAMGALKARTTMEPITVKDEKVFARIKKQVNHDKPVVMKPGEIAKRNQELKETIADKLDRHSKEDQTTAMFITPEMAIPEDQLR